MASGALTTYWDVVQYLADTLGTSTSDGRSLRQIKRAVLNTLRDVPGQHNWTYYSRDLRLDLNAAYSTGTVTYDHTGGASERLITGVGTEFPIWAANGVIYISNIGYQVDTRGGDTTLTLKSDSNPQEDVTTASTYTLVQERYTLPTDFRRAAQVRNARSVYPMEYVSPGSIQAFRDSRELSGVPRAYTYVGSRDTKNRLDLLVFPAPSTAYEFDVTYQADPTIVYTPEYSEGTITVSGTTVTGASTTFTSDMVGAVIRTGTATKIPDGRDGTNIFAEERLVKSFTSATELELDSAFSGTYTSATKYRISDLFDVSDGALLTYALQYAEMELARLQRSQDYQQRWIALKGKRLEAMAQDHRHIDSAHQDHFLPTRISDWRTLSDYA